ncbi:glucose-1-phosphate thymidylyltransferase RfbA [Streptomyces sp. NPDC007863]|uniref:glucose-1-phosphate thymidylyltransferase RfbA n=1 Tax=Streptomyces sp. NPDC007863 TaxID=3154894 RepID=UPI0033C43FDC
MRGIILAGGTGSRLWPATKAVSKQLIPVFDKPMIYYPLSTLLMAGVSEVLIITAPSSQEQFQRLLGSGHHLGIDIEYAVQNHPGGLAQAFLVGEKFIGDGPVALILGDNIFHGPGLARHMAHSTPVKGGHIFACVVPQPQPYAVIELDGGGNPVSLEEKPGHPRSHYAVPGLYFYDNQVIDIARSLTPSPRGELEITDVNTSYLERGELHVTVFDRDTAWMDAGTFAALTHASEFVRGVEERQGIKIGCVEETAWRLGRIDDDQLARLAAPLTGNGYGEYLLSLLDRGEGSIRAHQ